MYNELFKRRLTKMVSYILVGTLRKILRQETVAKKIKPLGIYPNAFCSSDKKEPAVPAIYNEKQTLKLKKKGQWKILTSGFPLMGIITLSCLGVYLFLVAGSPDVDVDGNLVKDELSKEPILRQYMLRAIRETKYYLKLLQNPQIEKLLPDPLDPPYNQPKYTLVIELTDVLVHPEWTYSTGWRYKKRPLLDHFLDILKGSYEIVLYTAEPGRTVFSLIDTIDPNNIIAYKLVHGTTGCTGFKHVKNLDKLNRNLKKVICVDWNAESVTYNPENLLNVKRWTGKEDDTSLLDLATFLKTIAENEIEDVREVLKYYKRYSDPIEAFRKKQEKLIEELDAASSQKENSTKIQPSFKLLS